MFFVDIYGVIIIFFFFCIWVFWLCKLCLKDIFINVVYFLRFVVEVLEKVFDEELGDVLEKIVVVVKKFVRDSECGKV